MQIVTLEESYWFHSVPPLMLKSSHSEVKFLMLGVGGLAFEETYIVIYVLAELSENGESSLSPAVDSFTFKSVSYSDKNMHCIHFIGWAMRGGIRCVKC